MKEKIKEDLAKALQIAYDNSENDIESIKIKHTADSLGISLFDDVLIQNNLL